MPQSLVLNLVPETQISSKYLNGPALYRLFLGLVSAVDPELAQILQADSQRRAFTLSSLQQTARVLATAAASRQTYLGRLPSPPPLPKAMQYQHRDDIPANTPCWWRISLLDDKLFNHLSQVWSTALPQQTWYLGSARLNITSLASTAQQNPAWASSCSYQALYEQASDQQRDLHLQFLTPASFRLAGYVSPLPTRDALFHCLRRRWNRYSGLAFAPDLVSPIVATEFQLHTVTVSEPTANRVGCLGQMRFQILGDVDRLTIKRINTLVDFTRYCSVGAQTMSGMGLMHRLHPTAAGDHGMASDS